MKRNEACRFLTRIASSEIIDMQVCKELIKARDIVVCEPNAILDVLATERTKEVYKNQLIEYLELIENSAIIDMEIRGYARNLVMALKCNLLEDKCEQVFLDTRCRSCKSYSGEQND